MTFRQLLATAALAFTAGCASTGRVSLNDRTAKAGSAVSAAAISGLNHFADGEAALASRQRMLRLAAGSITIEQAIAAEGPHYGDELDARIAAFEALAQTYSALAELSESTAPADVGAAASRLSAATATLTSVPSGTRQDLGDLAAAITALAELRTLRERNAALASLAARYARLLHDDLPILHSFANEDLKEYQRLLLALPSDRFDPVHLASTVKEPFARDLNPVFYKVESIESGRTDEASVESELASVAQALDLLASVHRQLARPTPSVYAAAATLDQIDQLIGTKTH